MVQQRREAVRVEAGEDLGGAAQAIAGQERRRHVEEQGAEVLEGALRIGGHALQERLEAGVGEPGRLGRLGHRGHLRGQEVGVRRVPKEPPHEVQIERARYRLGEQERFRAGRSAAARGREGAVGEVVPRDVRHDVGGDVLAGDQVALLALAPERQVQEDDAVPARLDLGHAEAVPVAPQRLLQVVVERDVPEGALVVDGELIQGQASQLHAADLRP
ncbi:hypothetical protein BE08_43560 [Sorangium cellulosum]|uniref:Uncharacterized protein n=1 Tax=Sorangium cellulosum TaxID=56 RepID=A0A150P1U7_SORCE|nr:hypothetical protein BE08_43560 [Sorangium cellulosum]